MTYDIIIIGGGPAGLTAAIYALRANKTVLIFEKDGFGGQMTHSPKIENYPGYECISGAELADKMFGQATALGADIEIDEVREIIPGATITVNAVCVGHKAKAVIIAAGAKHRVLGVPGEERFTGDGVYYCAVCDGAFYAGGNVAVVGGGNSGLQEAALLSEICKAVTVIQDLPTLTGEARLQKSVASKPNVKVITGAKVLEFPGEEKFGGVKILKDGAEEVVGCDAAFVAVGLQADNAFVKNAVALDKAGCVASGEDCLTNAEGIFAAGDCRTKRVRQITTATGDGAVAALAACRYIDALNSCRERS